MEPTPNNNNEPSPKRRRSDAPLTPGSAYVERIVPGATASPLRNTPRHNSNSVDDENFEGSQMQDDLPLTQEPSLLIATDRNTNANSSTRNVDVDNSAESDPSTEFAPIVPMCDIPQENVDIIKEAIADVYGFEDPRPFQIEAINHLAFQDDSSLVLIRRTADGKSLVPLTVSCMRGGLLLFLCHFMVWAVTRWRKPPFPSTESKRIMLTSINTATQRCWKSS